tara:strand:- start:116 stop:535 length:420 start_codon:yes stop_codon:yes gene_type:complete
VRAWDFLGDFIDFGVVGDFALPSLGGGHFADFVNAVSHFASHDFEHGILSIFTTAEDSVLELGFPIGISGERLVIDLDDEHALHGYPLDWWLCLAISKVLPYGCFSLCECFNEKATIVAYGRRWLLRGENGRIKPFWRN